PRSGIETADHRPARQKRSPSTSSDSGLLVTASPNTVQAGVQRLRLLDFQDGCSIPLPLVISITRDALFPLRLSDKLRTSLNFRIKTSWPAWIREYDENSPLI
ncbi:hypothetical protein, partial [Burkholderia sp.]